MGSTRVYFMMVLVSTLTPRYFFVKSFISAYCQTHVRYSKYHGYQYRYSNFGSIRRSSQIDVVDSDPDLANTEANVDMEKKQNSSPISKSPDLHRSEGIFAVYKPLEWTSQDVVSYIRKMLERDARERGLKVEKVRKKGNRKRMIRVGHGGTLDPLACGILVIGVGNGTKQLQRYLDGNKRYRASAKLGFETTTLDLEGETTREASFTDVTVETIESALLSFTGNIMQVPPIFSAIRKNGKKLYEEAREGKTAEDLKIQPREVSIQSIQLLSTDHNGEGLPSFGLDISCGKGTYIRSLVRDVGRSVDSAATMTWLERTHQGPFRLKHALQKEELNPDNIYAAIEKAKIEVLQTT